MIDFEIVRQHLKLDEGVTEDHMLIGQYLQSAVAVCEGYCGRRIYLDAAARAIDRDLAKIDWAAARAEYDDLVAAADGDRAVLDAAESIRSAEHGRYMQRVVGIVLHDDVKAAILMVLGHLYKNRQEVVVAQYSGATQLPAGARKILERYLYIAKGYSE